MRVIVIDQVSVDTRGAEVAVPYRVPHTVRMTRTGCRILSLAVAFPIGLAVGLLVGFWVSDFWSMAAATFVTMLIYVRLRNRHEAARSRGR